MEYEPCVHVCVRCGKCENCCPGHEAVVPKETGNMTILVLAVGLMSSVICNAIWLAGHHNHAAPWYFWLASYVIAALAAAVGIRAKRGRSANES
jgi:hypothetical protein